MLTNLVISGFPARDGEQHKWQAFDYRELPDDKSRQEYFKEHSVRYFELARLSYFDPVRMCVIDPMHNIFLGAFQTLMRLGIGSSLHAITAGIMKVQWYEAWAQTKALRQRTETMKVPRELDKIHAYLDVVCVQNASVS